MTVLPKKLDVPAVLLVSLLSAHFVVVLAFHARPLIPDERYFVERARHLVEHRSLPRVAPEAMAAERGLSWGTSDWRPQGYTLFVALCSLGDFSDPDALRLRVMTAQFLLMAGVLLASFRTIASSLSPRGRLAAAVLFGAAPWPFEFVDDLSGADSLNASVVSLGLLLLGRWTSGRGMHAAPFIAAAVTSTTLLIRPEMIVIAPLVIALSLALRPGTGWRAIAAGCAAFLSILAVQIAYRTWFTGHVGIYGGQHILNRGAFHWVETWPGTEKEGYDFVYALTGGRVMPLPARAFGSPEEKAEVERVLSRIASTGSYTAEDDHVFERIAGERRRKYPVLTTMLRLWHGAHIWLNLENPHGLLEALEPVPRNVRRPIYGALLGLRLLIYALAAAAFGRALGRLRSGRADALDRLTLLAFGLVLSRTLLVSVVLNWKVHRYALAAWPAMLWCAAAAFRSPQDPGARLPAAS